MFVPSGNPRRECIEAIMLFSVYMVIYWLKNLISDLLWGYFSTLAWAMSASIFVGATVCLLFVMEKIVRRRNLSVVGFRLPTSKKVLLIFTGVTAFFLIGGIFVHTVFEIRYAYLNIYFISGVILGPLVEEIAFRGLIQTRFEAWLGTTKSWILSSLVFGFYHFLAWFLIGGKMLSVYYLAQLMYVTLFGMLLGIVFAKTRSLLPPFLLHAVNNFIAFLT